MKCFYDPRDFKVLAKEFIDKTEKQPAWIDEYESRFQGFTRQFIETTNQIMFDETSYRDPQEVAKRIISLIDEAVIPQSYGYLTEIFTHTKHDYWVNVYLEQIAPELNQEAQAFLLRPSQPSFVQEYEAAVHSIDFEKEEEVQRVRQNFYWIKGSYEVQPELTPQMIKQDAQTLVQNAFDPSIKDQKIVLISRVKEKERLQAFVHAVDRCVVIQDIRKANVLRLNYVLRKLVTQLQVHFSDWSVEELLSFSPREILKLVHGTLPVHQREMVESWNRSSVWVATSDWYAVTMREEAVEMVRDILREEASQMIKGYVAFKGQVTGKVRIVLSEHDFAKVESGDILVTSMTRPEFLPVMRKAAAFVTNEGGITCHAAIVARELQKPCVIGTRVATTVLKDGQIVEVDADRGVVTVVAK